MSFNCYCGKNSIIYTNYYVTKIYQTILALNLIETKTVVGIYINKIYGEVDVFVKSTRFICGYKYDGSN